MGTVCEVIEQHRSEILDVWMSTARARPSAQDLTPPELASMMPKYLSLLGKSEREDAAQLSVPQKELIEHHLANRLREGFDLNEILTEFSTLGRCVFRFMHAEPTKDQPTVADIARLFGELHLTSTAVTQIYNEQLLEDEQRTKRYTRLLQNLASEPNSIRQPESPVRRRLDEALSLIMEATAAQTAALLLFDAKSRGLIMSASAGDADEHLEQYVSSTDASSFAGRIAAGDEEATSVMNAATTELEVSDTLRQSGIHSLLGVRLAARHLLRGVIYIGIREKRSFSPSEVRRLQSLGDALLVHVENAQLQLALREKIAELDAESLLRERFISILMHDLRGPLSIAKANAQLLLAPGTHDVKTLAARIVKSADRLDWMVGDLLDANRIRAGQRIPLDIEECNLNVLVRDVIAELTSLHGQRFVLQGQHPVRGMWGEAQLRRLVWNLATNAIQHGEAGASVILSVAKSGEQAVLTVHNDGPAISAEAQAHLFAPFERGRAALAGDQRGWGLGLTLVWGCVEAHGGRVSVESLPDKGTTFTVSIPFDARAYAE